MQFQMQIYNLKRDKFAHISEYNFSELLTLYNINWIYEPSSFPLKWGSNGNATMMFKPDFYLPDYSLYIEITTMEQKHVTKKNKKYKLASKLYPNIKFKIIYDIQYQELVNNYKGSDASSFQKAIAS